MPWMGRWSSCCVVPQSTHVSDVILLDRGIHHFAIPGRWRQRTSRIFDLRLRYTVASPMELLPRDGGAVVGHSSRRRSCAVINQRLQRGHLMDAALMGSGLMEHQNPIRSSLVPQPFPLFGIECCWGDPAAGRVSAQTTQPIGAVVLTALGCGRGGSVQLR